MKSIHVSPQQINALKARADQMLFGFQRDWINAGCYHRERMITKHRQAGAEFTFSLEAVIDALETGRNQYFMAENGKHSAAASAYISAHLQSVGVKVGTGRLIFDNSAIIDFVGNKTPLANKFGNVYFTEFAWANHCDELTEKARSISMHRQFRRTFYTSVSPKVDAFNLWRGPYEKDATALTVPRLQGGFLGSDGVWRQSQTIENSIENGYNLLRLEDIKREFSAEDFNMMFMCQWPQQQTNVKGESNV